MPACRRAVTTSAVTWSTAIAWAVSTTAPVSLPGTVRTLGVQVAESSACVNEAWQKAIPAWRVQSRTAQPQMQDDWLPATSVSTTATLEPGPD